MLKMVDKELKGSMFQQNENDKEKNYKKELNRYSGALKYINKKSSTWFNSKFDQAENRINKFEDRTIEIIQAEEQKENKMKGERSQRDMWDMIKQTNKFILGIPEDKNRQKEYLKK